MAKGFKAGAGGGAPLNFKVVGNPQPASPKENTIWVNTDVPISSWVFSAENPILESEDYYSRAEIKYGYYLNGSGTGRASSNFDIVTFDLPEGATHLTITAGSTATTTVFHAFFDASDGVISTIARKVGTNDYSVPQGAVKVRVSIRADDTKAVHVTYVVASEGTVWFRTGPFSSVAFNALKKNGIQVYPLSARQYVGGALVNREAKIYQDGKWKNFDKVLFTIGGDIAEFRIVHNSSASVSVTSDKIVFTANSEFYSDTLCEYPTPLDLSPYSAIEAKVKVTYLVPTYGHFFAYVATTPQHYSSLSSVARAVTTTLNDGMEQTLRISLEDDVFDTGLLYVGFNCLGSAEVYDWRLV